MEPAVPLWLPGLLLPSHPAPQWNSSCPGGTADYGSHLAPRGRGAGAAGAAGSGAGRALLFRAADGARPGPGPPRPPSAPPAPPPSDTGGRAVRARESGEAGQRHGEEAEQEEGGGGAGGGGGGVRGGEGSGSARGEGKGGISAQVEGILRRGQHLGARGEPGLPGPDRGVPAIPENRAREREIRGQQAQGRVGHGGQGRGEQAKEKEGGVGEAARFRPGLRAGANHRSHGFQRGADVPDEVEELGRGRPGPGQGGQRALPAGGDLLLRGAPDVALVPLRGRRQEGRQELSAAGAGAPGFPREFPGLRDSPGNSPGSGLRRAPREPPAAPLLPRDPGNPPFPPGIRGSGAAAEAAEPLP